MVQNLDSRCVLLSDPSSFGARVWAPTNTRLESSIQTRLESSIKKSSNHNLFSGTLSSHRNQHQWCLHQWWYSSHPARRMYSFATILWSRLSFAIIIVTCYPHSLKQKHHAVYTRTCGLEAPCSIHIRIQVEWCFNPCLAYRVVLN